MSITFKDFFQSAENLLNNPDSQEIDYRNLISRSYYAAFHLSREISSNFPEPNTQKEKLGSHEKVILKFEQHQNTNFRRVAIIIAQLRDARNIADYELDKTIVRLKAAQHFYAVKGLIKKLEQLNV